MLAVRLASDLLRFATTLVSPYIPLVARQIASGLQNEQLVFHFFISPVYRALGILRVCTRASIDRTPRELQLVHPARNSQ